MRLALTKVWLGENKSAEAGDEDCLDDEQTVSCIGVEMNCKLEKAHALWQKRHLGSIWKAIAKLVSKN